MKNLSVTLTPSAQAPNPIIVYNDVVDWDYDQMHGLRIQLEDDVNVLLNTTYILAVVEKPAVEEEQAELWDVDEETDAE
jgi:hypothetical protein